MAFYTPIDKSPINNLYCEGLIFTEAFYIHIADTFSNTFVKTNRLFGSKFPYTPPFMENYGFQY